MHHLRELVHTRTFPDSQCTFAVTLTGELLCVRWAVETHGTQQDVSREITANCSQTALKKVASLSEVDNFSKLFCAALISTKRTEIIRHQFGFFLSK